MKEAAATRRAAEGPPPAVAKAMRRGDGGPSADKLEHLKQLAREARDALIAVTSVSERLAAAKQTYKEYREKKLPDFMEQIRVPSITLEADGNLPAFEATRKPFYSAGISKDAENSEERREAMYEYLDEIGHGDLVTKTVTFDFPREVSDAAIARFIKAARKIKLEAFESPPKGSKAKRGPRIEVPHAEIERGVHSGRLTAWLKRQVEDHDFVPDLSKIGGFIGTVVDLLPVKEKKKRGTL